MGLISDLLVNLFFIGEEAGARNSVFAAANPVVRAESDRYKGDYRIPVGNITKPSKLAQDETLAKQLWSLTEKIVEAHKG